MLMENMVRVKKQQYGPKKMVIRYCLVLSRGDAQQGSIFQLQVVTMANHEFTTSNHCKPSLTMLYHSKPIATSID